MKIEYEYLKPNTNYKLSFFSKCFNNKNGFEFEFQYLIVPNSVWTAEVLILQHRLLCSLTLFIWNKLLLFCQATGALGYKHGSD